MEKKFFFLKFIHIFVTLKNYTDLALFFALQNQII